MWSHEGCGADPCGEGPADPCWPPCISWGSGGSAAQSKNVISASPAGDCSGADGRQDVCVEPPHLIQIMRDQHGRVLWVWDRTAMRHLLRGCFVAWARASQLRVPQRQLAERNRKALCSVLDR